VVSAVVAKWLFFFSVCCILTLVDTDLASFWGWNLTLVFGVRLHLAGNAHVTTCSGDVLDRLG
jgi:hypothetical protein